MVEARHPRRRDDDLISVVAGIFAGLPPWAPFVALAACDGAVALAFAAFDWPIAYRPLALAAVTLVVGVAGLPASLNERDVSADSRGPPRSTTCALCRRTPLSTW